MKVHEDLSSFLPLSPSKFYVLLSLAEGDKHGYAILKDVARQTQGQVQFSASTLYGIIQQLETQRLIRESGSRPDPALDDERRRYYCLTDLGRQVAAAEAQRLKDAVSLAEDRKLVPNERTT